jgi:hypothetical protein
MSLDSVTKTATVIKLMVTTKVVSDVAAALPSSNKCGFVGAEATDFFFCVSTLIKILGYVKPNTAVGELLLCWEIHTNVLDITSNIIGKHLRLVIQQNVGFMHGDMLTCPLRADVMR